MYIDFRCYQQFTGLHIIIIAGIFLIRRSMGGLHGYLKLFVLDKISFSDARIHLVTDYVSHAKSHTKHFDNLVDKIIFLTSFFSVHILLDCLRL